jgi:hypothetical protein
MREAKNKIIKMGIQKTGGWQRQGEKWGSGMEQGLAERAVYQKGFLNLGTDVQVSHNW